MRDSDGFMIRCKHSDWKIVDDFDNKDFVCSMCMFGTLKCHADEKCKDYVPDIKVKKKDK